MFVLMMGNTTLHTKRVVDTRAMNNLYIQETHDDYFEWMLVCYIQTHGIECVSQMKK